MREGRRNTRGQRNPRRGKKTYAVVAATLLGLSGCGDKPPGRSDTHPGKGAEQRESRFGYDGVGTGVFSVIVTDSKSQAHVMRLNVSDGSLEPVSDEPYQLSGDCPSGATATTTGQFYYAVNACSDSLTVAHLSKTNWNENTTFQYTAGISEIAGSPYPTGHRPSDVIASRSSRDVIVANEGDNTVSLYTADPTTGALTLRDIESTVKAPGHLEMTGNGRFAFVIGGEEPRIDVMLVKNVTMEGHYHRLTRVASAETYGIPLAMKLVELTWEESLPADEVDTTTEPTTTTTTVKQTILYVATDGGVIQAFKVNRDNGELLALSGWRNIGTGPVSLDVLKNRYMLVTLPDGNMLRVFAIDPYDAALHEVEHSPFRLSYDIVSTALHEEPIVTDPVVDSDTEPDSGSDWDYVLADSYEKTDDGTIIVDSSGGTGGLVDSTDTDPVITDSEQPLVDLPERQVVTAVDMTGRFLMVSGQSFQRVFGVHFDTESERLYHVPAATEDVGMDPSTLVAVGGPQN